MVPVYCRSNHGNLYKLQHPLYYNEVGNEGKKIGGKNNIHGEIGCEENGKKFPDSRGLQSKGEDLCGDRDAWGD